MDLWADSMRSREKLEGIFLCLKPIRSDRQKALGARRLSPLKNISFILCMMDLSSTFRLQSAEQSEQRGKQMSRKLDTHPGKDW